MASAIQFFGTLGVVASQSMNALTIPSAVQIIRAKSTLAFQSFPIIIALANALHSIAFAAVSANLFVMISSSITLFFNLVFLTVHLIYSKRRRQILLELVMYPLFFLFVSAFGLAFKAVDCTGNAFDCVKLSQNWLGFISTVISILCYCGQLSAIRTVIATKNASSISPWMTAGVGFRAVVWNVYAQLVEDPFNFVSSSIGIASAITQIVLLNLFPSRSKHE